MAFGALSIAHVQLMILTSRSALLVLLVAPYVQALWPFREKRYTAEALIDAGSLGVGGSVGRVVAVGDWNGDQSADLFTVSSDSKTLQVYLWNRELYRYFPSAKYEAPSAIINVIPADFDQDGRLDVLVMLEGEKHGWWGGEADTVGMEVLLGAADGKFGERWNVPSSSAQQPLIFDANTSLRPSLFGFVHPSSESAALEARTWLNDATELRMTAPPLDRPDQACTLANPHSSAFIDMDGNCLPDLVLHCADAKTSKQSIQIWLNNGSAGYSLLAKSYELPKGSGPLSFADMDRDGTIDIVFPVCSKVSGLSGHGIDCSIHIAYNRQVPVCSTEGSSFGVDGKLRCRGWGELCTVDAAFELDFGKPGLRRSGMGIYSTALAGIMGEDVSLLLHPPAQPHITLPLRPGDFDIDGYPDLLVTVVNPAAKPSGSVFSSREGTQARILRNVPCRSGLPGCENGQERTLVLGEGKGWEVLDGMWDVTGASWIDIDDDGSLDIMVQRSGEQGAGNVNFIQNNFYRDAFFLKAQVLNGACDGDCDPVDSGRKYSSTGPGYSGATYKLTVLDTLGRRRAQQVAQLPQSGYHALDLPYAYIGLGRTNNYVERLSVGVSLNTSHTADLDSIIPNSHLIINPPHPDSIGSSDPPVSEPARPHVRNRPSHWHTELSLHPGDWIPYVAAAVLGTVIILGGVVLGLHEREKKEDEKERRRALHAINFQAL